MAVMSRTAAIGLGVPQAQKLHKLSALTTLALLIAAFAFGNAAFLSINNAPNILLQTSLIGILGIGMTIVIINRRHRSQRRVGAGLSGNVLMSPLVTVQPNEGVMYELDAIAAGVIGGASLIGGVGSISAP